MLKKIGVIVRKIIFSFLFLYAYNKIGVSYNLIIPFNYFTVGLITLFGIPSIFLLILFAIFCI